MIGDEWITYKDKIGGVRDPNIVLMFRYFSGRDWKHDDGQKDVRKDDDEKETNTR